MAAYRGWNRIRKLRWKILQSGMDDAAKPARREPSLTGRLVNGDDPADFQRSGGFLLRVALLGRISQDFELRLHQLQLSAAILFHLAVKSHQLSRLEAV